MRIFNHAGLLITITPTDMPLMQTSTRRSTLRRSRDHSCTGAVVEEAEISSSDLITTRIEDDFYIDVEFLSGLLNRAGLFQTFGVSTVSCGAIQFLTSSSFFFRCASFT